MQYALIFTKNTKDIAYAASQSKCPNLQEEVGEPLDLLAAYTMSFVFFVNIRAYRIVQNLVKFSNTVV